MKYRVVGRVVTNGKGVQRAEYRAQWRNWLFWQDCEVVDWGGYCSDRKPKLYDTKAQAATAVDKHKRERESERLEKLHKSTWGEVR